MIVRPFTLLFASSCHTLIAEPVDKNPAAIIDIPSLIFAAASEGVSIGFIKLYLLSFLLQLILWRVLQMKVIYKTRPPFHLTTRFFPFTK